MRAQEAEKRNDPNLQTRCFSCIAHRQETVAAPDLQRYCWLQGDLEFETLRQAVIEPDHRVWIGSASPPEPIATEIIRTLSLIHI